mgnify:CR=1 FL=1
MRVSAAVDVFLDPQGYLKLAANHALRAILDRVLVVVNAGMVSVGVVGLPTMSIPARPTAPRTRNTARNGQME